VPVFHFRGNPLIMALSLRVGRESQYLLVCAGERVTHALCGSLDTFVQVAQCGITTRSIATSSGQSVAAAQRNGMISCHFQTHDWYPDMWSMSLALRFFIKSS
jgi:hypothetical protein